MKRRTFIQQLGAAAAATPFIMGTSRMRAFAHNASDAPFRRLHSVQDDRILVVLRFFGGNDGLNTLVPFTDDRYYNLRGRGTQYDLSVAAESVQHLEGYPTLGFHPAWSPVAELYKEGKVVAVQNVGYPNQNMSHFRSADIWFSASDADVFETSGWYARYLEEKYPDYPGELPSDPFAIELDTSLGLTLIGRQHEMGMALNDLSYIPEAPFTADAPTAGDQEEYIREVERQSNTFMTSIAEAEKRQPKNNLEYPEGQLPAALARVARLVAGGLGTQLYIINVDGFDTHDGHMARHAWLLGYCADAIHAFQRDIEAFGEDHRLCMMTTSEFGRRVIGNGTGTDHGAAAPMFLIGSGVRGGIIGSDPDLGDLDDAGNLKMVYDFRQVYASVLGQWFGADERDLYPAALPRWFSRLPIFKSYAENIHVAPQPVAAPLRALCTPNPAGQETIVRLDPPSGTGDLLLELSAPDGRVVFRESFGEGQRARRIDLRPLPSGVYFVRIAGLGINMSERLVVQH